MKGKKVIHRGRTWGNEGTVQIASWKCNFGIYLDIKVYYLDILAITTLLCLLLVLYLLVPSIYSIFYLTTALLKSDVFWHSKAYSSHSFQRTGIGLGSLWRGNRCMLQLSRLTYKLVIFNSFYLLKLLIFPQKISAFQKKKNFFFLKRDNWAYVYMY